MSREQRLALVAGFAVLLAVAVLISDHMSRARTAQLADGDVTPRSLPEEALVAAREVLRPPEPLPEPEPRLAIRDPRPVIDGSMPADHVAGSVAQAAAAGEEPVVIHNGGVSPRVTGMTESSTASKLRELARDYGVDFERFGAPPVLAQPDRAEPPRHALADPMPLDEAATRGRSGQAGADADDAKSARVHIVRAGESLYKIAEKTLGDGNRWREIAAVNEGRVLRNGGVQVGVRLVLPDGAARGSRPAALPGGTPETKPAPARDVATPGPATSGPRDYVVRKGDTLGLIAQRELGTTRRKGEILELNRRAIDNENEIFVGMAIRLPAR